jgi:formylmethanofuran dehydrogenase subunit E
MKRALALAILTTIACAARAETPAEWVALGIRVHGGFGTFIPLGIRIGEDALHRLGAGRRDVTVVYSTGGGAPCPCVADGIAIATMASVGQGTLRITPEPSPDGTMGVAVIKDKRTCKGFRYTIPAAMLPKLLGWNKGTQPLERFRLVMDAAPGFEVEPAE